MNQDNRYEKRIIKRPDCIGPIVRPSTIAYDELAETLKKMKADDSLPISVEEAIKTFGKGYKSSVHVAMKIRRIKGLRMSISKEEEMIYIWIKND